MDKDQLSARVSILSSLHFPYEAILLKLPFFMFSTALHAQGSSKGVIFLTRFVARFPSIMVKLFTIIVFIVFSIVDSTGVSIVVSISFVGVDNGGVQVFSLWGFVYGLLSGTIHFFGAGLSQDGDLCRVVNFIEAIFPTIIRNVFRIVDYSF